ncbi:MAG: LysR family transcriptional regulator [Pseudomonadota bacterium]|nr:LysR family transcriptional regulator [Pseudomonadota bacterium]
MEFLQEMVVFAKVVELRSFSEAARRFGVTSSAVSRSVGRLEAHMGGRLLHRTTRSVAPTELGHEVFGRCTLIAQTARDVKMIASRYAVAPVGRLRVSAPVAFGQQWVGPRLPGFLARWPDVEVSLTLDDRELDLVERGLDLALCISHVLPPSVVARSLLRSAHVLVASPAYLDAHGRPRRPAELADHRCVLPPCGDDTGHLCMSDGRQEISVPVRGPLTVNHGATLLDAVDARLGIGLLPDFSALQALAQGRVERVLPEWTPLGAFAERKVYAVYLPTRHLPQKVRAFIDHLALG